jgi:hypothetical protein
VTGCAKHQAATPKALDCRFAKADPAGSAARRPRTWRMRMPYEERSEPTGLAIKRLIMAMQSNEIMRMAMGEALKRVREKHGRKRKRASTTHEQLTCH